MASKTSELFITIGANTEGFKSAMGDIDVSLRKVGIAVTAVGGTIMAVLGMCTKAAADEEIGIKRLEVAMDNVGLAYGGATGELEKWINAQQQSTAFADDQQREALSTLIPLTKDVAEAQNLLNLAMDMARWKNIDLVTSAELVSKVYAGDLGMLKRYGIIVDENATSTEALAQIQQMAAGQAEAYVQTAAGQMELLKNNMGDVMESIGNALVPILTDLFKSIQPILEGIKNWISENPELVKTLVIAAAAIGGLLTVLGPLLIMLPGIISALPIMGAAFAALTGPIGLVIAAIAALAAIVFVVIKNWDAITQFFGDLWEEIENIFSGIVDWMGEWGILFIGPVGFIIKYWGQIKDFFKNLWSNIVGVFESAINSIIDGLNWLIEKINLIPEIDIGSIGKVNWTGNIKAYATGGIVPGTVGEPQLAMVHGGEKIIPAGGEGGSAGGITNNFNISELVVREEADINRIARELHRMAQSRMRSAGVA